MENLETIRKELNWKEKIVFKLFTKLFVKVYNIARINTLNVMLLKYGCPVGAPEESND